MSTEIELRQERLLGKIQTFEALHQKAQSECEEAEKMALILQGQGQAFHWCVQIMGNMHEAVEKDEATSDKETCHAWLDKSSKVFDTKMRGMEFEFHKMQGSITTLKRHMAFLQLSLAGLRKELADLEKERDESAQRLVGTPPKKHNRKRGNTQ